MPLAARMGALTSHNGTVAGPGAASVIIEGLPAAVALDTHICGLPPQPHPPSPFPIGSQTVLIGGRQALRMGDTAGCGGQILLGASKVDIGG